MAYISSPYSHLACDLEQVNSLPKNLTVRDYAIESKIKQWDGYIRLDHSTLEGECLARNGNDERRSN